MSSLPPLTSRQLSELRDTAQNNLVSQLCDALMESTSKGTVKDKIKEPLAEMMIQIMQSPENASRLSDSVHSAIHKSLENSVKGPLLLYTLLSSDSGFEEVKKDISNLFTRAYGEKSTIRAFRGKLYAILQNPMKQTQNGGGNKKSHRRRAKNGTKTRKLRYMKGGNKEVITKAILNEAQNQVEKVMEESQESQEREESQESQEREVVEKAEVVQNVGQTDLAAPSVSSATLPSNQHDLREYNNALLDEMKKSIQEVGEQMTSKMIDALFVSVKSNADTIVSHIVNSVSKTVERDELIKKAGPIVIVQALRASSTDIDKALISTFDEIRTKEPESDFDPTQSTFLTSYMQKLQLRLTKQVTGK